MGFSIPDMVPPGSGSPVDNGVRTARATTDPSSSSGRKKFSAVLHGVREDERRTEPRGTDNGRSTNKADHKARAMDTDERNPSSVRSERTTGASSRTQAADEDRSSDTVKGDAKDSPAGLTSSTEQSSGASDVQGRTSEALSPAMSSQAVAQAIGQTDVHAEGDEFSIIGEQTSDEQQLPEHQAKSLKVFIPSATVSPIAANSSSATTDSKGTPVLSDGQGSEQHDVPSQDSIDPIIHAGNSTIPAQVVRPGSFETGEGSVSDAGHRTETRFIPQDSHLRSTLSQMDAIVSGSVPAHLEAAVPGRKSEIAKTEIVSRDGVPIEHVVPAEVEPVRPDHQGTGGRISPVVPYGQASSLEGQEGFNGFLGEHKSGQQDQPETKVPQQTVPDRLGFGEQPIQSIMAGAQGHMGSNQAPPAPSLHPIAQVASTVPTHSHTDQFAHVMTRSVAFNVIQPDLGQVNIRVAMTSDVVHTHLSTDRPEVGQFLLNGQDRLQAALQASGLDMGQFRVDIDRQGAGRSFQQGFSQEQQGHAWNQHPSGADGLQTSDTYDDVRGPLQGLLNVMA